MQIKNVRAAAIAAASLLALALPAGASAATPKHYYLSLGDSLSVGWQPDATTGVGHTTNTGYADDLEKLIASRHLTLEKLGCPGEKTGTMISGGVCAYPGSHNQLAAAVKFIKTHKVSLITIDIGANDVDNCATAADVVGCAVAGGKTISTNVPKILKALRTAAGRSTEIVGMTYYDPFLAYYLGTPTQQPLASESVGLAQAINNALTSDFKAVGGKTADVATAFSTYVPFTQTSTLAPYGTVPTAVAQICTLTWMCAASPVGPNIHANNAGYTLIAQTFRKVV